MSGERTAPPGAKLLIVDRYANVKRVTEMVRQLDR